jgi:hypothetical protein
MTYVTGARRFRRVCENWQILLTAQRDRARARDCQLGLEGSCRNGRTRPIVLNGRAIAGASHPPIGGASMRHAFRWPTSGLGQKRPYGHVGCNVRFAQKRSSSGHR